METYIIAAKRTAIGKYGGAFLSLTAIDLAVPLLKNVINNHRSLKNKVNEVIIGNALPAGLGQNLGRLISVKSGLSVKIPAYTVNFTCGSGLKSVILGHQSIQNGDANLIVVGGTESMSRCPYYLDNYRFGVKFNHQIIRDGMITDGLYCNLINKHMGITAENVAKKYKITREMQDAYAFQSHRKANNSIKEGVFKREIVIINQIGNDEQPRIDCSIEKLSRLKPVFKKGGTVTAGNASTINDGAALALLASSSFTKKYKLKPMAVIRGFSQIGCDPKYMGMGAYYAISQLMKKTGLKKTNIDLWEINEAFASQSIAVIKALDIDPAKVNVYGGAIALGHPIGASGARILTTLLYALKQKKARYGIASLCIGGGQGIAMLIENL